MVIARTLYHTDFHKCVVLAGNSARSEEGIRCRHRWVKELLC
jgi:hypothetical protein